MLKSVCAACNNMKADEDGEDEKYCSNPNTRGNRVGRGHLIIAYEVKTCFDRYFQAKLKSVKGCLTSRYNCKIQLSLQKKAIKAVLCSHVWVKIQLLKLLWTSSLSHLPCQPILISPSVCKR